MAYQVHWLNDDWLIMRWSTDELQDKYNAEGGLRSQGWQIVSLTTFRQPSPENVVVWRKQAWPPWIALFDASAEQINSLLCTYAADNLLPSMVTANGGWPVSRFNMILEHRTPPPGVTSPVVCYFDLTDAPSRSFAVTSSFTSCTAAHDCSPAFTCAT